MSKTETTYHADLIGDGLHDDTAGIQTMLDAGTAAVYLPPPPKHYLISRTLIIHSGQTLRLDPFTVIRLAPHSDTVMITNDDHEGGNENIALVGGISRDKSDHSDHNLKSPMSLTSLSWRLKLHE